ncbi:glycoside hydrolase, family 16 [Rhypophila decipiens]
MGNGSPPVTTTVCRYRCDGVGSSRGDGHFRDHGRRSSVSVFGLARQWAFAKLFLLFLGFLSAGLVKGDCECGYSTNIGGVDGAPKREYVFTDLLETNFLRLNDIAANTDWQRQEFNISKDAARGDYGEMFLPADIEASPAGAQSGDGDDSGLKLVVRSGLVDGMVQVAEIDSYRPDLSFGSFRASMKMTDIPGTCAAFFWYFNDTQEIDMEFLSREFNSSNNTYPVNLVLQSRASLATHDASSTGYFIKANLPFNPTTDFHEYRIDYIHGQVLFYADGAVLAQMNGSAVPTSPGHLVLQHWSNGNALWSGGPPARDAVLTVEYVKAYFNSSLSQRAQDWRGRCKDPYAENAVCAIPSFDGKNSSARDWFFSDHGNMTNNQTVSNENSGSSLVRRGELMTVMGGLFLASGWVTGFW